MNRYVYGNTVIPFYFNRISLDRIEVLAYYNIHVCTTVKIRIRGCTGFDGGFEIAEAIRRLGLRHQLRNKYKRRRKFSVRCLMAAV